jgi:hypothetical protein
MTYRIYQFGSTVLPDYNEESEIGLVSKSKSALDIPSGGALDLYAGEKVLPGAAKPTKSCTLHATTEAGLLASMIALRVLVGTRAKLYRMIVDDNHLEWAWARFDNLAATRKYGAQSRYFQDVRLSFTVYSPAWYSQDTHYYSSGVAPSEPDDLTTLLAESGETTVLHVYHSGNIDQPAAIFTITATGTVTLVTINNATTGYSFRHNGTLFSGKTLVIDTGAVSVLNDGVDDYAHFTPPANHEDWIHIAPGANTLLITIVGGGKFTMEYYAAFA